jgi:hypothetical protein
MVPMLVVGLEKVIGTLVLLAEKVAVAVGTVVGVQLPALFQSLETAPVQVCAVAAFAPANRATPASNARAARRARRELEL